MSPPAFRGISLEPTLGAHMLYYTRSGIIMRILVFPRDDIFISQDSTWDAKHYLFYIFDKPLSKF